MQDFSHLRLQEEIRKIVSMSNRTLYIVAGCNGAGKTTASFTLLPELFSCMEFVNADEIARGLSPFRPDSVALEAGRAMLNRIKDLTEAGETFAFETTLSANSYIGKIRAARKKGYMTVLIYIWLEHPGLAKERVRTRVNEGGHDIPPNVIERRYTRGIRNLFVKYLQEVDGVFIIDNSEGHFQFIASRAPEGNMVEHDAKKFAMLKALVS